MKAILKFDLDDYDDIMAHKRAIQSSELASAVWEFLHNGHRDLKHHDPDKLFDGFTEAQGMLYKLLDEHGINVDELTY